jgi:hypothetical protein
MPGNFSNHESTRFWRKRSAIGKRSSSTVTRPTAAGNFFDWLSCEHDAEASFLLAGSDFPYLSRIDPTPRRHPRVSLLAAQRKAIVASDVSSPNGDVLESIGLTRSEKYAARNFFWA